MNTVGTRTLGLIEAERGRGDTSPGNDKASLAMRYEEVRSFTEDLCDPLEIEDYVIQSMPDASPAKWHLAHTSWFFDTFVLRLARPEHEINSHFAYLFNSYYNAAGPMHCRPKRGLISRPTVEQVYGYRGQIDEQMLELMAGATPELWRRIAPLIELGLHHEQQHQELLLTDLKHLFAANPMYPVYRKSRITLEGNVAALEWLSFPGGIVDIGHAGGGFAFDNEGPRHKELLRPCQLASRLVTNGEYLEFIDDGGYERAELWLSLGWATVRENRWNAPLYWTNRGGRWFAYTLSGLRPVEMSEPVCHVSYFEADAFARWAGERLPTEVEWETAAAAVPVEGNFVEKEYYHPQPQVSGEGASGLAQLFGDVWEWTTSAYSPYPGFRPAAGAIGEYNGKFMCNQYVLRGGSCASPRSHVRHTYRNFFPPDKRWQFTGIRLAREAK